MNKFIQKNQHDEKFELNIILLQYLLGLLEKEGNQKVEKKESRKSEDEGISLKEENENLK